MQVQTEKDGSLLRIELDLQNAHHTSVVHYELETTCKTFSLMYRRRITFISGTTPWTVPMCLLTLSAKININSIREANHFIGKWLLFHACSELCSPWSYDPLIWNTICIAGCRPSILSLSRIKREGITGSVLPQGGINENRTCALYVRSYQEEEKRGRAAAETTAKTDRSAMPLYHETDGTGGVRNVYEDFQVIMQSQTGRHRPIEIGCR